MAYNFNIAAGALASGTLANARLAAGNVTQFESQLEGVLEAAELQGGGQIATNTSGVSTNASAIATNVSNITAAAAAAATNASGVSTNASGVSTNASNITSAVSSISANATAISALSSGIEWQDSVDDRGSSVPSSEPGAGLSGRYLKNAGGNEGIYAWNGTAEAYAIVTTLSEGLALWVDDDNVAIIYTGSAWATMASVSGSLQAANNLSDLASASTARSNLGVAIGTNVQAHDADLAAIAGLTSAANKGIQFTGSGTAATYDLTAAAKTLLDDASVGAMRTTLGVDAAGTDNSTNVSLAGGSKDYITLSGQALTIGSVDLTDDVTGTLPAANGGTGLTSISTLLNSNVTTTTLGLQNVTNESKATMFTSPALTGTTAIESFKVTREAITASTYTVDTAATETVIGVNTASNAVDITLPAAVAGRVLWVKDEGGNAATNAITIGRPSGSIKIDGTAGDIDLEVNYAGVMLYSDGTDWFVL